MYNKDKKFLSLSENIDTIITETLILAADYQYMKEYTKDLRGYKIADTIPIQKDATQGKDVYLTLDSSIQFFVEQAINNADKDYDYEWFHITIADAKTGAILATANSPSFVRSSKPSESISKRPTG